MKRRSVGAVIFKVSGWLTCVAAASATLVASPNSDDKDKSSKHGNRGNSPFVTMMPCSAADGARLRFVSGRNPFQGGPGGSAYGDIFFAGGGGGRETTTSSAGPTFIAPTDTPPAATTTPVVSLPQPAAGTPTTGAVVTPPGKTTTTATTTAAAAAADTTVPAGGATDSVPTTAAIPSLPVPGPVSAPTPTASNPEPASFLLLGLGLSGLAIIRRRTGRNRS